MTKTDTIFTDNTQVINDFNFDEKTAEVFDDMLDRSIPLYPELQRMMGELAAEFATSGSNVYDLGCSTGITLETLGKTIAQAGKQVNLIGLDYSRPMLDRAKARFAKLPAEEKPELIWADFNNGYVIKNASVVVLNLTLQFIRPLYRDRLIRNIADGLQESGGCLILVEKVLSADSTLNREFIKLYYDMKRRKGYSDMEIARKREALENVLIPYRIEENIELLTRNGFTAADVFLKWYNFAGIVAIKKG